MTPKIISLLSDGIDSPVAAYLMMKKGFVPVFLTFITTKFQQEQMENKIHKIAQRLRHFSNKELKLYIVPFTANLTQIIKNCPRKLTCILCKRLMYRIAIQLADKEGTNFILTGDILGEQASQTLSNLRSYQSIFRNHIKVSPLIGLNKMDVTEINKEIGVYEICAEKLESCQFYPQYPETNVKLSELQHAEELLNWDNLVDITIERAKIIKI